MATAQAQQPAKIVRALSGTHELVVETALRYVARGSRALDLGAGSGFLTERLQNAGLRVVAADIVVATAPLRRAGLKSIDLAPEMVTGRLQMAGPSAVTADIPVLLLPH
jgi:2-polyprenyl-3-methyl-5-hydroxy-6-metoxy-1,4-benzoquinol methylase